ncbi:hypothetical protein ACNFU2_15740 [Chryseobacterium sp. PTM-20240506]|uniref:hypothetical protein n=1 Tax=unclassified Chryseobacterium TaxID=2593645 RepID=UPI002359E65A|nr:MULTISPECIES: hypothetical protein [unclassified Chryseobacterium]MDC8106342.1 hypothetical protein [Chryseobacterium sp. B21-037]MDQ1804848.1 hypothetical protein [Chryseobacterium sp. CKR4-1]
MKKTGIILSFLGFSFCFGQSAVLYNLNNNRLLSNSVNKIGVGESADNDNYDGSPFLEKEFLPSMIKGESGAFLLRYNIYNDEIILKNDDKYYKIPKEEADYFKINNEYVVRLINGKYYIDSSSDKNNYVIVRKENITFTPGKVAENTYDQARPPKFSRTKPDYFLFDMAKKVITPLKKDEIKALFPNKSEELDQNFKKNKFKNIDDLNSLLSIIAG